MQHIWSHHIIANYRFVSNLQLFQNFILTFATAGGKIPYVIILWMLFSGYSWKEWLLFIKITYFNLFKIKKNQQI